MRVADLAKEFDRDDVHWRAQTLTKKKDKALALAYIDARHVMTRLDDVCGPDKWQSKFEETAKGRVICSIGIKVGDEWVWKSDGAGSTAVEGDKGGISDALKRAAVHWGIGRYLYDLENVWAPCTLYNDKFSDWVGSPWDHVRVGKRTPQKPAPKKVNAFNADETYAKIKAAILARDSIESLDALWAHQATKDALAQFNDDDKAALLQEYTTRMGELASDSEAA